MPTDPQVSVGVDGKDNRIYIEKSGADLDSIEAPDLDDALAKARGCPILTSGGTVELAEAIDM